MQKYKCCNSIYQKVAYHISLSMVFLSIKMIDGGEDFDFLPGSGFDIKAVFIFTKVAGKTEAEFLVSDWGKYS